MPVGVKTAPTMPRGGDTMPSNRDEDYAKSLVNSSETLGTVESEDTPNIYPLTDADMEKLVDQGRAEAAAEAQAKLDEANARHALEMAELKAQSDKRVEELEKRIQETEAKLNALLANNTQPVTPDAKDADKTTPIDPDQQPSEASETKEKSKTTGSTAEFKEALADLLGTDAEPGTAEGEGDPSSPENNEVFKISAEQQKLMDSVWFDEVDVNNANDYQACLNKMEMLTRNRAFVDMNADVRKRLEAGARFEGAHSKEFKDFEDYLAGCLAIGSLTEEQAQKMFDDLCPNTGGSSGIGEAFRNIMYEKDPNDPNSRDDTIREKYLAKKEIIDKIIDSSDQVKKPEVTTAQLNKEVSKDDKDAGFASLPAYQELIILQSALKKQERLNGDAEGYSLYDIKDFKETEFMPKARELAKQFAESKRGEYEKSENKDEFIAKLAADFSSRFGVDGRDIFESALLSDDESQAPATTRTTKFQKLKQIRERFNDVNRNLQWSILEKAVDVMFGGPKRKMLTGSVAFTAVAAVFGGRALASAGALDAVLQNVDMAQQLSAMHVPAGNMIGNGINTMVDANHSILGAINQTRAGVGGFLHELFDKITPKAGAAELGPGDVVDPNAVAEAAANLSPWQKSWQEVLHVNADNLMTGVNEALNGNKEMQFNLGEAHHNVINALDEFQANGTPESFQSLESSAQQMQLDVFKDFQNSPEQFSAALSSIAKANVLPNVTDILNQHGVNANDPNSILHFLQGDKNTYAEVYNALAGSIGENARVGSTSELSSYLNSGFVQGSDGGSIITESRIMGGGDRPMLIISDRNGNPVLRCLAHCSNFVTEQQYQEAVQQTTSTPAYTPVATGTVYNPPAVTPTPTGPAPTFHDNPGGGGTIPVEPIKPVDPVDPTPINPPDEPVKPVDPVDPTPINPPDEPVKPVDPVDPPGNPETVVAKTPYQNEEASVHGQDESAPGDYSIDLKQGGGTPNTENAQQGSGQKEPVIYDDATQEEQTKTAEEGVSQIANDGTKQNYEVPNPTKEELEEAVSTPGAEQGTNYGAVDDEGEEIIVGEGSA